MKNNLFTKCKSGFLPGDSCISQLLSITDGIYKLLNYNPTLDVTGTFSELLIKFGMKGW